MKLVWLLSCYFLTFEWCWSENTFPQIPGLDPVNVASSVDLDPLSSLTDRYPFSRIKGLLINPYGNRYSSAKAPYPSHVPYTAAKEYGLPGLGYVETVAYLPTMPPPADTDQQFSGFSIISHSIEETSPEEEVKEEEPEEVIEETTEAATTTTTTTTKRPTRPTLKPPPRPPLPPPPPPTPTLTSHAINKAPPKVTHHLPKLPPKPQTVAQKKKKPKMKLDNGWTLWEPPQWPLEDFDLSHREYTTGEEYSPQEDYRKDVENSALLAEDLTSNKQYVYDVSVPTYASAEGFARLWK